MIKKTQVVAQAKKTSATVGKKIYVGAVLIGASVPAFATDIDLVVSGGLATVSVVAGLLSAGGLKALPTYAGWGIKKALSMLR